MKHKQFAQMGDSNFFGHYQAIEYIGKGGFADIFLGVHVDLKILVAIKVLRTSLGGQESQKLLEEAQLVAKLDHSHIVRVFDYGIAPQSGSPYLVMQLAENGSLRDVYPIGYVLPLPRVLNYARQMGDALTYLHGRDLVHQDVKPENMLLLSHDRLLLSDFGLAVVVRKMMTRQPEGFACTLAYTAPERFQAHYTPDPASDQYALAVVMYEMLTGRCPFEGTNEHIIYGHRSLRPPSLCQLNPAIPVSVEQVILKALKKDPRQRFESVAAFIAAFESASQQIPERLTDTVPVMFPEPLHQGYKVDERLKKAKLPAGKRGKKLYGVEQLLLFEILFSAIPSLIALVLGIDGEKVQMLFTISMLVLPIVGVLLVWKSAYVRALVFTTLLLSIGIGLAAQNLFLGAIVQLALMAFSASIVFALRHVRVKSRH
jgi:serine/threonine protein kinase